MTEIFSNVFHKDYCIRRDIGMPAPGIDLWTAKDELGLQNHTLFLTKCLHSTQRRIQRDLGGESV